MPKLEGLEVLLKAGEAGRATQFIMISAFGSVENAVEATKRGAYDFITKPPDLNRLLVSVRNAIEKAKLVAETADLKKRIFKINEIVGESAPIRKVKETIDRVAPTEARVLITGANGSGKEMVAKQIHEKSNRANKPLVEVNCAAIPSELIESELFGYEKGAFTASVSLNKPMGGLFS
jgi:DNA-binding NtrC family response regulator